MPKYTTTVSVQVDIDTDTQQAVLFGPVTESLEYIDAVDWNGDDVDEVTAANLANMLTSFNWDKVFQTST